MNARKSGSMIALAMALAGVILASSCSMGMAPVASGDVDSSRSASILAASANPSSAYAAIQVATFASWETITSIQNSVKLPTSVTVEGNVWAISWSSGNASIISATGAVTRPANAILKNPVTLTATARFGTLSFTKTFSCQVVGQNYRPMYLPSVILNLADSTGKYIINNDYKCYETVILPVGVRYRAGISRDDIPYSVKSYAWYVNGVKQNGETSSRYSFTPVSAGEYKVQVCVVHYTKGETAIMSQPLFLVIR